MSSTIKLKFPRLFDLISPYINDSKEVIINDDVVFADITNEFAEIIGQEYNSQTDEISEDGLMIESLWDQFEG